METTTKKYSKYLFGMALARMNVPVSEIRDYTSFPHFRTAELPVDSWIGQKHYASAYPSPRFSCLQSGSVMDSGVSRAIVHEEEKHRNEFADEAANILTDLKKQGVHTASMDCGMEDILTNAEAEEALRGILLRLAPTLYRTGQTLLLPFRAPSRFPSDVINRFLRRTLLPWVKLRIDVHPYELTNPDEIEKTAELLAYEIRSIVFTYDADSGCRILKKHIDPWIRILEKRGYDGPILLAPMSRRQISLPEANAWDALAELFQNE